MNKKILFLLAVCLPVLLLVAYCSGIAKMELDKQEDCETSESGLGSTVTASPIKGSLTVAKKAMTEEQRKIASVIVSVGYSRKFSSRDILVALMVGMQESKLQNLPYGHLDSKGVFQQRPSQGWGTVAQVTNPTYATNTFYDRLKSVSGRENMSLLDIALSVQRPSKAAYLSPGNYFPGHESEARAILAKFSDEDIQIATVVDTGSASSDAECLEAQDDPVEKMVQAALSKQGDSYSWNDASGTGLVSWAAKEAGFELPDSFDKLRTFRGKESTGVSAELLTGSELRNIQRGDLLMWSSSGANAPNRVAIYTGATGDLVIGTFNVLGVSHRKHDWQRRIRRSWSLIRSNNVGVVGLQELQPPQRRALVSLSGGRYGIFPKTPQYGRKKIGSVNSIMWDKSKYDLVRGDSLPLPCYFAGCGLRIPLVQLKAKSGGAPFYVFNTHDPAFQRNAKKRVINAKQHAEDFIRLRSEGSPVFLTGDINARFGSPSDCILTRNDGIRNAYDAWKGRTGACPSRTSSVNPRGIDHVYVSGGVRITDYSAVRGNTGSDHPLVYVNAALSPGNSSVKGGQIVAAERPGSTIRTVKKPASLTGALRLKVSDLLLASGSKGAWQFPMKKGSYHYRTNSYGPGQSGHSFHNGTDFGTSGATPPLVAMHAGKVVRMGWGGAWGNYYVVETGVPVPRKPGKTYKYLYAHLSRFASGVKSGGTVRAGQYMGNVGDTGNSFGEHLHLTICTDMVCTSGSAAGSSGSEDPVVFLRTVGIKP